MDDPPLVPELKALADLLCDGERLLQRCPVVLSLLDWPLDVAAAHELDGQERLVPLLADVVDGDDVRLASSSRILRTSSSRARRARRASTGVTPSSMAWTMVRIWSSARRHGMEPEAAGRRP